MEIKSLTIINNGLLNKKVIVETTYGNIETNYQTGLLFLKKYLSDNNLREVKYANLDKNIIFKSNNKSLKREVLNNLIEENKTSKINRIELENILFNKKIEDANSKATLKYKFVTKKEQIVDYVKIDSDLALPLIIKLGLKHRVTKLTELKKSWAVITTPSTNKEITKLMENELQQKYENLKKVVNITYRFKDNKYSAVVRIATGLEKVVNVKEANKILEKSFSRLGKDFNINYMINDEFVSYKEFKETRKTKIAEEIKEKFKKEEKEENEVKKVIFYTYNENNNDKKKKAVIYYATGRVENVSSDIAKSIITAKSEKENKTVKELRNEGFYTLVTIRTLRDNWDKFYNNVYKTGEEKEIEEISENLEKQADAIKEEKVEIKEENKKSNKGAKAMFIGLAALLAVGIGFGLANKNKDKNDTKEEDPKENIEIETDDNNDITNDDSNKESSSEESKEDSVETIYEDKNTKVVIDNTNEVNSNNTKNDTENNNVNTNEQVTNINNSENSNIYYDGAVIYPTYENIEIEEDNNVDFNNLKVSNTTNKEDYIYDDNNTANQEEIDRNTKELIDILNGYGKDSKNFESSTGDAASSEGVLDNTRNGYYNPNEEITTGIETINPDDVTEIVTEQEESAKVLVK